jgi:hypothetical protein
MHGSSSRRKQPLNPTSPLRTLVLRTSYYLTVARDLQPGWLSLSLERHAAVRNGTNKPYWHLGAARSSSPFLSRMKQMPQVAACFPDAQCCPEAGSALSLPALVAQQEQVVHSGADLVRAGPSITAPRITWPCVADGADADVKRPAFRRKAVSRNMATITAAVTRMGINE